MSKLEFFVSLAIGQIATVIALIKRQPPTEKNERWIKGLKAASAALSEIIGDSSEIG